MPFASFSQLTANFTASPLSGCAPMVVSFTDQSAGGPTAWSWNFGNSGTSASQNPSTIYSLPGLYTVTLTVSNGSGSDTEIKTAYINVYNKPQASFTISTDTACVGQTVTLTSTSVVSPGGAPLATYAWDFGDGNAQSVTTVTTTHIYTVPGTYPVSLIVTDTTGCTGVINVANAIVVVPAPNAAFTASPNSACTPPLVVNFTNTSTSTGTTTYSWNFGDGGTSTLQNPSHTYSANGTYNVTLIVNQNGCIDSVTVPSAIIIQNIVAAFAATPTVVCTGQSINFTNSSVPSATASNWNFGDASTSTLLNPTHTYTAAGTYTVTLIASAGTCIDTTTGIVVVNQTPVASFTADTTVACNVPFTVNFTSTSPGSTSWDFGDGGTSTLQNPSHTYTAAGTYTVSLIVTNAAGPCSDTIVMPNYITISPPLASFTHTPDSGCVPLTVNFASTSTSTIDPIATYSWTFGDGSSASGAASGTSHTYTATGVYSVTLAITTANGCTDTAVCNNCIKVGVKPFANFGIVQDTVCYGLPVQFNDSSTGGVTGWWWDFGDGQTSMLQNPPHVYGDTGTYQVFLIAFNNGCADTSVIKNVVILPPRAVFSYSLSCTNYYTVQFFDASIGADSLFWNFGDGSMDSSNTASPVHTYPSRGPFTVTLNAYNYATGCMNSTTASFTIAEPIASYSMAVPYGCYPFTASFTSTSQDANSYWWNFGDTTSVVDTSIASSPTYTYNLPAANSVTLIITDVNGCKDTLVDTVKSLGPLPYFFADTLTGCKPFMVTFSDTSYDDSLLVQWSWNFGDGTPVVTTNIDSVVHVYTIPGIYTVTMSVTDTNGCTKTLVKPNYIQPTFPYPSFTVDTFACKGDILTLNASATTVVSGSYIWSYGDGSPNDTSLTPVITHSYTIDGLYIVSLTVTDINGCDSTVTDTVRILKPTANFGDTILNTGCGTLTVSFIDSSTGFVSQWYWDFGNGANSTLQNPTYTYTQPGVYDVTLIVTNLGGCRDTVIMDSIIVVPGPIGSFSFTPAGGCNPLTVCFDASSLNAEEYIWDFGDGTVVQAVNGDTCHTYTTPGTFNPVLILGNTLPDSTPCLLPAANLTGSVTVTNVINVSLSGPPVITVPEDSIIPVTATFSGGAQPYTYSWTPNTGLNCDTCTSVLIIGTGDTIVYTFTIYDTAGCIGIDSILVLSEPCIEEKDFPNVFTPNHDGKNDLFYIPGVCPSDDFSLEIYDRWGTLMFSTTLRNNGWDGRTNAGVDASEGVYYYVVSMHVMRPVEEDVVHKGFVHLLR